MDFRETPKTRKEHGHDHQAIEKQRITSEEPSREGVLETAVTSSSPVCEPISPSSSSNNLNSHDDEDNHKKSGHKGIAGDVAAYNPLSYAVHLKKGFLNPKKKKPGVSETNESSITDEKEDEHEKPANTSNSSSVHLKGFLHTNKKKSASSDNICMIEPSMSNMADEKEEDPEKAANLVSHAVHLKGFHYTKKKKSGNSDTIVVNESTVNNSTDEKEEDIDKVANPLNYAVHLKGFLGTVKKKSGVKKLSNSTIALLSNYDVAAKSIRRKLPRFKSADSDDAFDYDLLPIAKYSWKAFKLAELEAATDNFCPERQLGKGGNAEVFKGYLPDGTIVAVKRLIQKSDKDEEELRIDFLRELGMIAHLEHPNTAKLIGFGVEGGLYMVLQFAPHGSVASCLQELGEGLDWNTRFYIAIRVAEGLSYLHHTCPRRIIHRDIKASNILLAEDYEPMISDFGLAKWLPENWLHHVLFPIEGTVGYLAPEYFMHGIADEKTDAFAYGVLLLELITGREAVAADSNKNQSLVKWAKPHLESNNLMEIADPRLGYDYDPMEMKRAMITASMCIRHTPNQRPYMKKVVKLLKGEAISDDQMKQMSLTSNKVLFDVCDEEDYTTTDYEEDLSRHRELLME